MEIKKCEREPKKERTNERERGDIFFPLMCGTYMHHKKNEAVKCLCCRDPGVCTLSQVNRKVSRLFVIFLISKLHLKVNLPGEGGFSQYEHRVQGPLAHDCFCLLSSILTLSQYQSEDQSHHETMRNVQPSPVGTMGG